MTQFRRQTAIALIALALAACQANSGRRELGTLLSPTADGFGNPNGPALPGDPGAPGIPGPTAFAGAVTGGIASSDVGRALDEADRQIAAQAEYAALEQVAAGAEHAWQSTHSGRHGVIVPGEAYQINRSVCRDFTHTVVIDGRSRVWRGTACKQPDGNWRAVNA